MTTLEVSKSVTRPTDAVWGLLGDFGAVTQWNPYVDRAEVSGSGVGMTREIYARGGARIVEQLLIIDSDAKHLRYAVELESGAQSVSDVTLLDDGAGGTVVVWQSIREGEISENQAATMRETLLSRIDALEDALKSFDR